MFKKLAGKLFGGQSADHLEPTQSILDCPILQLSPYPEDVLTVGNFCESVMIFGGTGSGKSSGSGKNIARQFLASHFGGLVLCAKNDEVRFWQALAEEYGRSDDVIVFDSQSDCYFNFLDYECHRTGEGAGQTENLIGLFLMVMEATKRGGGSSDKFFEDSAKDLMRNAIDLARLAQKAISISVIGEIINSAPMSAEAASKPDMGRFCIALLKQVDDRLKAGQLSDNDKHDYRQTFTYWTVKFPNIAEKTRSGIIATFDAMGNQFARGELHQRFCTKTTVTPEMSFDGKIIIMNYPIKEFGDVGLYAQVVFKTIWQQAIERRQVDADTYPAFLWADECQFFLTTYDQEFLTTARSSRAATVFLTQNLPNFIAKLGQHNREVVNSLMGNFQTKVFHQNADFETNEWASKMIGMAERSRGSHGVSMNDQGGSSNANWSTAMEYLVQPNAFANLRKGGTINNLEVDAIVYQGGRQWMASGQNFIQVTFSQE